MRVGLAGLRTPLRISQEKDPRLSPIIATLRKQPKGSYIAEPLGPDGLKNKVRALQYRLASDGRLVAKDGPALLPDRPRGRA